MFSFVKSLLNKFVASHNADNVNHNSLINPYGERGMVVRQQTFPQGHIETFLIHRMHY